MRRESQQHGRSRPGFTIVELLCASGVVALLVGLIAPAVARSREAARRIDCCSHLREIGLALMAHEETHRALPPGWQGHATKKSAFGWAVDILPWVEQRSLSGAVRRDRELDDPVHADLLRRTIPLFSCPSDPVDTQFALFEEQDEGHEGYGQASETVLIQLPSASYVGVFGTHDPDDGSSLAGEGAFICQKAIRLSEFERGLSQTMLVSERTARKLPSTWLGFLKDGEDAAARVAGFADIGPNRDDADECEFDSRHPGQINVLWGDGRVEPVGNSIDGLVYRTQARLRR